MVNLKPGLLLQKLLNRKRLIIVISAVIIAVIAIAVILSRRSLAGTEITQRTEVVRIGQISTTVTGSGALTSSNRTKFSSKVEGTVTSVYFKEGDRVEAGDLLLEIESPDAQNSFDNAQSSYDQMMDTLQGNIDDLNSLRVVAPFDGQITSISADIGSTKSGNDAILTIVDTSKLKLQLTFTGTGISDIQVGRDATVYIQDFMDMVTGKITYVSSMPYTTSTGGELYNVDIEVFNPGSLQEGMKASAEIQTSAGIVSSIDSSSLLCINKKMLKTAGGTVEEVYARLNQYVKKGELLAVLENPDVANAVEDSESKAKNLRSQLDAATEQLDSCRIYSPIDGVIVEQAIDAGDSVKSGDALAVVSDDTSMEFTIPVDELDIAKLKVGQEAIITVDALSETALKPLTGSVTHVAQEGTSSNGVTTYNVTVSVGGAEGLKGGMNANAEIYINKKTGVLTVPLEAIQKVGGRTYVMVKGDAKTIEEMKKNGTYIDLFGTGTNARSSGGNANSNSSTGINGNTGSGSGASRQGNSGTAGKSGAPMPGNSGTDNSSGAPSQGSSRVTTAALSKYRDYYKDAIPTPVEVGINDETNIEIVSGLNEGDVVILPPLSTSSSTAQTQQGGAGFMTGGGMPAGGNMNTIQRASGGAQGR